VSRCGYKLVLKGDCCYCDVVRTGIRLRWLGAHNDRLNHHLRPLPTFRTVNEQWGVSSRKCVYNKRLSFLRPPVLEVKQCGCSCAARMSARQPQNEEVMRRSRSAAAGSGAFSGMADHISARSRGGRIKLVLLNFVTGQLDAGHTKRRGSAEASAAKAAVSLTG